MGIALITASNIVYYGTGELSNTLVPYTEKIIRGYIREWYLKQKQHEKLKTLDETQYARLEDRLFHYIDVLSGSECHPTTYLDQISADDIDAFLEYVFEKQ